MKKRPVKKKTESQLEQDFLDLVISFGLPRPTLQHIFHPTRQWRFDFSWPNNKLAVEVQGHENHYTRPGAANDYCKHNAAMILGWKILYVIDTDIGANKKDTIIMISKLLGVKYEHNPQQSWTDILNGERRRLDQAANS